MRTAKYVSPWARRLSFNLGWALGRIFQAILDCGTQNANGEWRILVDVEPLGAKIDRPRA